MVKSLSSPDGEAEGGEAESGADSEARMVASAMILYLGSTTNKYSNVT